MRHIIKKYPAIKRIADKLLSNLPSRIRLGRNFYNWYAFYQESEGWELEKLKEYQLEKIKLLIKRLISTSDFYKNKFNKQDIEQIESLDVFSELFPELSKKEFRDNYNKIFNSTLPRHKLELNKTSGTTGMPLQFYHLPGDWDREWAAICYQWKRINFSPARSRRAEFRSLTRPGRIVERFPYYNKIRCSILDFNPDALKYYADEIIKNKIDYYHGYPSALSLLSSQIDRHKIKFPEPIGIMLSSEFVHDHQINTIKNTFPNSKLIAHYGCAERTVLGAWCEQTSEYHILPQYSFVEFNSNTNEIIGTNLYNTVNGFVRYKMTDTVIDFEDGICPKCKRPFTPRIIKLGGRIEDYLYSPDKGWMPPAILTFPFKDLSHIREVQFYQKEKYEINLRYISSTIENSLVDNELEHIKKGLKRILGNNAKIKFNRVKDFERGPTGKFKWIINELEENPALK